jgi:hyaluronan synthase
MARCYELVARARRLPGDIAAAKHLVAKAAIVTLLAALVAALCLRWDRFSTAYEQMHQAGPGLLWLNVTRSLLFLNVAVFLWRLILVIRYRPTPAAADEQLPTCTVIVPAYNEGPLVLDTLASVVLSDYPAAKVQIIAVDDGSVDDTWRWIETAAARFPQRIVTLRLANNSGKRRALYEGFIRSTGEILVTIDSDSVIETQTLRRLLSPFVCDSSVGAVAGNVRILNSDNGLIPKMLDVSFAYSFDFTRASQSMVDTVFCTPGALSAYRRHALFTNLERWLNQRFFGRQATIGEDRAITNLIIKDGWKVKFQSDAVVYTAVPCEYRKLCRMLLRWARSNIRETITMAGFIFTNFRRRPTKGARVNFLTGCTNLLMPRALLGGLILSASVDMDAYLLQLLAGTSVWACAPALFYAARRKTSDALYAFSYAVFWLLSLSWITPYAIFTAANGKWLTRDLTPGNIRHLQPAISNSSPAAA